MLKFIKIHGVCVDVSEIDQFTEEELDDAYFDLKTEQVNVQGRLGDLRIDREYDKVREAGLKSAARHIALSIEYIASLRRARKGKVSDRFMDKARESLDRETFDGLLDSVR